MEKSLVKITAGIGTILIASSLVGCAPMRYLDSEYKQELKKEVLLDKYQQNKYLSPIEKQEIYSADKN